MLAPICFPGWEGLAIWFNSGLYATFHFKNWKMSILWIAISCNGWPREHFFFFLYKCRKISYSKHKIVLLLWLLCYTCPNPLESEMLWKGFFFNLLFFFTKYQSTSTVSLWAQYCYGGWSVSDTTGYSLAYVGPTILYRVYTNLQSGVEVWSPMHTTHYTVHRSVEPYVHYTLPSTCPHLCFRRNTLSVSKEWGHAPHITHEPKFSLTILICTALLVYSEVR